MAWIGELERTFATALYPLRVPIAIGLLIGFLALVLIARRRGWFAAAARHQRRTVALVVVVLAVGLPISWYLGSPLFIRTSLVEPAPGPTASARPSSTVGAAASFVIQPSEATPTVAAERTGAFQGADEFHFGSGTARLIEGSPGAWVVRFESFSVRNGPDLYVYLSPDAAGYADGAVELGTLRATDGAFNVDVPAGTDLGAMRSVVIWCKQFAVQFAHAELR
jgi:hypothetical protein